jgi:hypothetical protein
MAPWSGRPLTPPPPPSRRDELFPRDEITELFDFVDLDDSKVIEFKEFLVALTVGESPPPCFSRSPNLLSP